MGKISLPEVQDTAVNLETRTVQAAATAVDRSYSKQLEAVVGKVAPDRTSPEDANTRTRMVLAARESNHDDFVRQAKTLGMKDASAIETLWTQCLEIMRQNEERQNQIANVLIGAHNTRDNTNEAAILEQDRKTQAELRKMGVDPGIAVVATQTFNQNMGLVVGTEVNGLVKRGAPQEEITLRSKTAYALGDAAATTYKENRDVAVPIDREQQRRDTSDNMMANLTAQQREDLMNALAGLLDHSTLNYLGEKYQMQAISRDALQRNYQTFLDEERHARNEKERERLYQEFAAKSGDQETAGRLYQYYKTENTQERDDVVVAVLTDHSVARWYLDNGYPALVIPSKKSPTEIA